MLEAKSRPSPHTTQAMNGVGDTQGRRYMGCSGAFFLPVSVQLLAAVLTRRCAL